MFKTDEQNKQKKPINLNSSSCKWALMNRLPEADVGKGPTGLGNYCGETAIGVGIPEPVILQGCIDMG